MRLSNYFTSLLLFLPLPSLTAAALTKRRCYLTVKGRPGDTCENVAGVFNLSIDDFRRMNPGVTDCARLTVGAEYCVMAYGDAPTPPSPQPAPLPHQSPITQNCKKWYKVTAGDTCLKVERSQGVSDTDFRAWNGFLNKDCSNLWLAYWCCVGV